jgi:uncharacterized protein with FMN-binding domain
MRKSSTRTALVIGGTLAGVSTTVAFGAQAALFPQQGGSALNDLVAAPSNSAPINSGSSTPTASNKNNSDNKVIKKNNSSTPTPKATKSSTKTKTVKKPKKNKTGGNTSTPAATETTPSQNGPADGTYTGSNAKALNFGSVQVKITVSGGQLTDISFLSYPQRDGRSVDLSNRALPQLRQQALNAQSANVSNISGASWTTRAFKASLNAALTAAGL